MHRNEVLPQTAEVHKISLAHCAMLFVESRRIAVNGTWNDDVYHHPQMISRPSCSPVCA